MLGELMWTCLVWAERSTFDSFWVPSHRFNSTTGEQKGITQTIYTDSEPPSRMPNSLMPSAKRQAPISYLFGVTRSGIEPRPPAPRADTLTIMLRRAVLSLWEPRLHCPGIKADGMGEAELGFLEYLFICPL